MTTRTILTFSLVLSLLLSCSQKAKKDDANNVDSTLISKEAGNSYTPTYFDYKNTRLTNGYIDTAFAKFSNDSTNDCFTISVPQGLITDTKTTVRITTQQGEIIYEHVFPTSDLVNGYATEEIKSDSEMEEYVLSQAKIFLKDGLIEPNELSGDSYLSQAAKEDFENYDVFIDIKQTDKLMFHYCLNEENHYYLGYSDKQKKVVQVINCC